MIKALSSKKQTSDASASVVDGKLILSLPDAKTPVVWQMDLTTTKASALEVQHNEETDIYTLTLKTPRGETIEVAPFTNREYAVEGLMAASSALENAHGQIRGITQEGAAPANDAAASIPAQAKTSGGSGKKWLIAILSVAGIFVLFNIWAQLMPRPPASVNYAAQSAPVDPRNSAGVPVSADEFLRAQ